MAKLLLYYTDGCHLCDDAISLLIQCDAPYQKIDIITSSDLTSRFATTIPVIENGQGLLLNWPFTLKQLQHFIK